MRADHFSGADILPYFKIFVLHSLFTFVLKSWGFAHFLRYNNLLLFNTNWSVLAGLQTKFSSGNDTVEAL